jgi:hypothetical protein
VGRGHECDFTYRPGAERLVHVDVDVVIDVIVVEIIAGGVGGVVVARVMIRLVAIVVLAVLVQHHRGEHVGRARGAGRSFRRASAIHCRAFRRMTRIVHRPSWNMARRSTRHDSHERNTRESCDTPPLDTRRPRNFLQARRTPADVSRGICKEETEDDASFRCTADGSRNFQSERSSSASSTRESRERSSKSPSRGSRGSREKLGPLSLSLSLSLWRRSHRNADDLALCGREH